MSVQVAVIYRLQTGRSIDQKAFEGLLFSFGWKKLEAIQNGWLVRYGEGIGEEAAISSVRDRVTQAADDAGVFWVEALLLIASNEPVVHCHRPRRA